MAGEEGEPPCPAGSVQDLSAQILGGWWSIGLEALDEILGQDKASEAMRPYMEHSARAGYLVLREKLGMGQKDMRTLCLLGTIGHQILRKVVAKTKCNGNNHGVLEFRDCPFKDCGPLACVTVCYQIKHAFAAQCDPGLVADLPMTIKNGDERCEIHITRKGAPPPREGAWEEITVDMSVLSPADLDIFFRAYMAEFWLNTIRALDDALGEESVLMVLSPRMRCFGMSLARSWTGDHEPSSDGCDAARLLTQINESLAQETGPTGEGASVARTIPSCPFRDAPDPACALVGSFLEGVCSILAPGSALRLTKGLYGSPCSWEMHDDLDPGS